MQNNLYSIIGIQQNETEIKIPINGKKLKKYKKSIVNEKDLNMINI